MKPGNSDFTQRVLSIVRTIPPGSTKSYKEVAALAGSPGASRAVGSIMKHNYDPTVPCHRVIKSDGTMGDYNRGGPSAKALLLQNEKTAQ